MGRRPGRKRKQGVARTKSGRIIAVARKVFTDRFMEGEHQNIVEPTLADPKKATRKTVLEAMGVSGGLLEAGKELERLWHLCRRYATSAPNINAKVSSLEGTGCKPHEGELTEEVVDFGVKVHGKYQGGIMAMASGKLSDGKSLYPDGMNSQAYAHSVIRSVIAACVENKPLTVDGEILCKQGLKVLADHWNY